MKTGTFPIFILLLLEAAKMQATDRGQQGVAAQKEIEIIANKIEKIADEIAPYDKDFVEGVD